MLTLFGTFILAIAIGAGAAFINDLFFFLSLKNHKLKPSELNALKQLNTIQLFLITWIILVEITLFALGIQYIGATSILGDTVARFIIELVVLFCALSLRKVHMPALFRHQRTYHHLSDSFIEHSNALVATCVVSFVSWSFIVLITSTYFSSYIADFGFSSTFLVYVLTCLFSCWLILFLKNSILHNRFKKK